MKACTATLALVACRLHSSVACESCYGEIHVSAHVRFPLGAETFGAKLVVAESYLKPMSVLVSSSVEFQTSGCEVLPVVKHGRHQREPRRERHGRDDSLVRFGQ